MKKFTQFWICIIAILFLNIDLRAQQSADGCNIFLQGNYLEVGINWNGAYGSSGKPPAGYHPDTLSAFYNCDSAMGTGTSIINTDTALGFVADVDKDGWNVGTPKYYGDYILPGAHQEGWSLLASGTQINEWNNTAGDSATLEGGGPLLGGLVISSAPQYLPYTFIDDTDSSTSTSSLTFTYQTELQINQYTVLDTSKLFFTTYVFISNQGFSDFNNVYYLRTIKPQCDALLPGGSYRTHNQINYAYTDSLNIVSSTSTIYPKAYIALGSSSTIASCFLIKNAAAPLLSSTIDNIANGLDTNYLYAQNDSGTNESGIGLVFNLGDLAPTGFPDSFSFVYAFTPEALSAAFGVPYDTASALSVNKNVVPATNYVVYPNPFKTTFSIGNLEHTDHIQLYDELGRNVSFALINTAYNTFTENYLPSGLYVLLVENQYGTVKWKTPLQKL